MALAPLGGVIALVALPVVFGPAFAGAQLAVVFTLLVVGYLAASGASTYASALLFDRPRWIVTLLGVEIIAACVMYFAATFISIVAVAAAVALVHLVNLALLRQASMRAL